MLRAVGMDVVLDTIQDPANFQATVVTKKDFDVSTWGMSAGPDDSAMWTLSQNLMSSSPSNRVGFDSERADAALMALRSATTDDRRIEQYRILAEEVNEHLPLIQRVAVETITVFNPKVHGVLPTMKAIPVFYDAWMEQ